MKKLILIVLLDFSAFFSCTTKAQDSVLNTNDIVGAISTSLPSNFSFSVRTFIPKFNTLSANEMVEYRFYRKSVGSIYVNHQREFAVFQAPIDRERHHSFDKAKWLYNSKYALFWAEPYPSEDVRKLKDLIAEKLIAVGYCQFPAQEYKEADVLPNSINMSKPLNEFNKWFEQWVEGIGMIAEFRLIKSTVSSPIKPDIASSQENAAYTNGYSSGYAFRKIQDVDGKIVFTNEVGRIVAYYPKVSTRLKSRSVSEHTNAVDSAFIQGWLLGESDAMKDSVQHDTEP